MGSTPTRSSMNEEHQPELLLIVRAIRDELQEKHPDKRFVVLKLHAPGYVVSTTCTHRGCLAMIKATADSILVDCENIKIVMNDVDRVLNINRHKRVLEIDLNDPLAVDKALTAFDALVV